MQKYTYGNRCGHKVNEPRLYQRPQKYKKTCIVLQQAHNRVAAFYNKPTDYLHNLQFARETSHKQRSEAREAVAAVAGVIVNHVDLEDMRIVQCTPSGKMDMTVSQIANKANIGYKRCLRAIRALKEAMYLEVEYSHKLDEKDRWYMVPRIKHVQRRFFIHLGITNISLEKAINYIYKFSRTFFKSAPSKMQFVTFKTAERIRKRGVLPFSKVLHKFSSA